MAKKILAFVFFSTLFCLNFLYSQEAGYVDKDEATSEISMLKESNSDMESQNSTLTAQNKTLQEQIVTWKKTVAEQIVPLQKNVTQKVTEIRSLLTNIVDAEMHGQASTSLNRGLELMRKLEVKRQQLETSIFQAHSKMMDNLNTINRNNQKIEKNKEMITYLETSLRNTEEQNAKLQDYIDTVTDFISNSENILQDLSIPGK